MLPLALFRIPSFTGVQLGAFAIAGSQFALFLYITLYLQNILGYSPLEAGLRYLPITLASFFVAPIAGQLMARIQPRFLIGGGLALAGLGLILMSGVEEGDTWTTLLAGFLVGGVGIGLLNPPTAAVSRVASSSARRAAWPPGSTTRSARSASPSGSQRTARCSSDGPRARSPSSAAERDRGADRGGRVVRRCLRRAPRRWCRRSARGLLRRLQRDPPDRRRPGVRGRDRRCAARAPQDMRAGPGAGGRGGVIKVLPTEVALVRAQLAAVEPPGDPPRVHEARRLRPLARSGQRARGVP